MEALSRLLHAAEVGDQAAFAQELSAELALLQQLAQNLMSAQLRALVTPADIVQQALLDAYRFLANGGQVRLPSKTAWLQSVVENVAGQAARRYLLTQKRCPSPTSLHQVDDDAPSGNGVALGDALAHPGTSPSSGAAHNQAIARLPQLMARLPADRRQVLQLVYFEGRSIAEAASILGRSAEATRKLLGRAIGELAVLLAAGDAP